MLKTKLLELADVLDNSCYAGGVIDGLDTAQRYSLAIAIRKIIDDLEPEVTYNIPARYGSVQQRIHTKI